MNILEKFIGKVFFNKLRLCFWILILSAINLHAQIFEKKQSSNYSGSCCIDSIKRQLINVSLEKLKRKNKEYSYQGRRILITDSTLEVFKSTIRLKLVFTENQLPNWLNDIIYNSLKVYGVKTNSESYFIASTPISGATGLGSNFYSWIILDLNNGSVFTNFSLIEDPSFFYINTNSQLEFYIFDFDKNISNEESYDHIPLNIKRYNIIDFKEIEDLNVNRKCFCN